MKSASVATPSVYWLIKAQRSLCQVLDRHAEGSLYCSEYARICRILAESFPGKAAVIVRDRLHGYRNRIDQHILLVEVIHELLPMAGTPAAVGCPLANENPPAGSPAAGSLPPEIGFPDFVLECCRGVGERTGLATQSSAHIVKIADPRVNKGELDAWVRCRPAGLTHDNILMILKPGVAAQGGYSSIIYEDAHHVIGAGLIVSMEEAMMDYALFGSPSPESVAMVVKCLFERLGADFYSRSSTQKRSGGTPATLVAMTAEDNLERFNKDKLKLEKWLDFWQEGKSGGSTDKMERLRIRRETLAVACASKYRTSFMDPVDYLRSVITCPKWCPLLLWGCSHGDLHGRNILVSIMGGDATLPALFDYEDMGLDNAIGWDFVKLETELKVRVLPRVFGGTEIQFIGKVLQFEHCLAERTHLLHDQKFGEMEKAQERECASGLFKDNPQALRLATILFAIRREAREQLGLQRLRDRQWLEELYFLMACYGVRAACYDNYDRRSIICAYLSAGAAARMLSRPYYSLPVLIKQAESAARELCDDPAFANRLEDPALVQELKKRMPKRKRCEMTHEVRLAFACVCSRSGKAPFAKAVIPLLKKLRRAYPHAIEIDEELCLVYLDLGDTKKAEGVLDGVQRRYRHLSMEMLCRFGRRWKDRGINALREDPKEAVVRARPLFKTALEWYERAYSLDGNYYPGINVATLHYLCGETDRARKVAGEVLTSLGDAAIADPWVLATKGEALLLTLNNQEAENAYQTCCKQLDARGCESAAKQARLIVEVAPLVLGGQAELLTAFWTEAKFREVFSRNGTAPAEPE